MERLTFEGNFCDIAMCREIPFQCDEMCSQRKTWERLKEYEDTGLVPEEIKKHEAAYNECLTRTYRPFKQKISQWLQAEKDGRLVVLPCKVGDTVYSLSYSRGAQKHFVAERKVEEILYCSNRGVRPWIICCFGGWRFDNCDIGKTVFLTREEAEAALAQKGSTNEDSGSL